MHLLRKLLQVLVLFSLMTLSQIGLGAQVVGVKGKKVLINLQGEPAQKGDLFYLIDKNGKKKGLVKIRKIKGNKAIALLKGKARKGYTLQYKSKGSGSAKKSKTAKTSGMKDANPISASPSGYQDMYWGLMVGMSNNSMTVKLKDESGNDRDEVSMTGSGFSAKGLLDYKLLDGVWFRGLAGIEQFVTAGEKICGESSPFEEECTADIMYFSLDMWGRYVILEQNFRPWVGAGFSLMVPLSKTSTALDEESITNTSVMAAGLGFDYFLSPTMYFPVSVEYGLLPSSEDVTANLIAIRIGAGFSF